MKKIIVLSLLFCFGCQDPVTEKVENSVESVDTANYVVAKQNTIELINSAEMKYMSDAMNGDEKDCYTFDELNISQSITAGTVCYENNDYVVQNVHSNGYICSGTANNVQCEEEK